MSLALFCACAYLLCVMAWFVIAAQQDNGWKTLTSFLIALLLMVVAGMYLQIAIEHGAEKAIKKHLSQACQQAE